jgi:hypothetical protein
MFRTGGWNGIPAGSRVSVTLDPGSAAISGTFVVEKGPSVPILHSPVGGGNFPLVFTVEQGERNKLNLDATFTGAQAQVTFTATLTLANGQSDVFRTSEAVTDGDPVFTIKFFANT